jgi:trimethylamine--corrinoid protein Co-methyltransferase
MEGHGSAPSTKVGLSVLTEHDILRIHEVSLRVLEKAGIVIHYPLARQLLRDHGATAEEGNNLVRIPRSIIEQAIKMAPRRVTMHSQSEPNCDCYLGPSGGHYARPATGLNYIIDAGSRKRRPVTASDGVAWTRVAHALPNIHFASAVYDQEGSPECMELRAMDRMLRYTNKPLMISAVTGEGIRWAQRMAEVVQDRDRQPRVMALSSVNSPLTYEYGQSEAAMAAAEVGIVVAYNSSAITGATCPITLAGALAQMNAEMLAVLAIVQLHRPGAPVVQSCHPVVMDMRSGSAGFGFAEVGLMAAASIQMGQYYQLPTGCNGLGADSCTPDAMAIVDKWAHGSLAALCGANVNGGAGSLGRQGTISLEQLAIDNDIFGNIFRQMRGIEVSDDTLAEELILDTGHGGTFLGADHTALHYRNEYHYSKLGSELNSAAWEAAGCKDTLDRAIDLVRKILDSPEQSFVSQEQGNELEGVLRKAEHGLRL